MKSTRSQNILAAGLIGALALQGTEIAQSAHFDELANSPFAENRPTKETAQTLRDELMFQRATQT
jgi:hypothetical protein